MGYKNYRLKVIKGYNKGDEFPLEEDEIIIGRGEDSDIIFNIAEVSRSHAVLSKAEGGFMIKDLGSTNGTFVDKKEVGGKYLLKPGDTVMLGDAIYLTYQADVDPEETLVAPRPDQQAAAEVTAVTPQPVKTEAKSSSPAPAPPPPAPAVEDQLRGGQAAEPKKSNTWLWAGIGCLVVIFFLIVVGVIIFDYLNLYCTPPFDSLMKSFWTCPS